MKFLRLLWRLLVEPHKVYAEAAAQDAQKMHNMCEEFARKFPGKCMICAYHRFGRREGYTQEPSPEPHECIERNT